MADNIQHLHPANALTPEKNVQRAKAHKRKAQLEAEKAANQPLLNVLDIKQKDAWKPGGALLRMLPYRLNKKGDDPLTTSNVSYITANNMDMALMRKYLNWNDVLQGSEHMLCRPEERLTTVHKTAVALFQKLAQVEIHLPKSIRSKQQTVNVKGITEEQRQTILRRRCNEVYFKDIEDEDLEAEREGKIFWDSEEPKGSAWSFGDEASSLINETALLTLFTQRAIIQKTSEMEVERLAGNYFMQILQGSARELETKVSSATEIRQFMPFSAFGIRPRPDCVVQIKTGHALLMPISLIAEAKASDEEFGPFAQLASVAHNTLAFLTFTWGLKHSKHSLPDEAVLPGVAYSSGRVHIYGFYPFRARNQEWNFRGLILYQTREALAQMSSYDKLGLMSQMLLIQNAAYKFGKLMKNLIEEVYVGGTGEQPDYVVNDSILKHHTEDDQRAIQRTMGAFTKCIQAWSKLHKIE